MTTIKILHIYKTATPFSYGGVESVIYNLTENLNNKEISSDVVCTSNKGEEIRFNNTRIIAFNKSFEVSSCPFSFKMLFNLKKVIKNYDIIHYHYPWPFADIIHLIFTQNKKTIVTYHSDIVKQKLLNFFYKPLEYFFLKTVDKIIATSPQYYQISPNLQKFANKVAVIPLGIKSLSEVSGIGNLQKVLPAKYFVFIGVLRYYKGLHLAFEAIQNTNIQLVIIGNGPLKKNLINLARKLKIENNVKFMGKLQEEEKIYILQNSQGLILPSHLKSEAFGVALLEAASLGKPLISCKINTGTEYANIHNKTGYCVPPIPTELKKALKNLSNDEVAKKFGENAKKRFENNFRIDIISQKYLQIYKQLCSSK